MSILRKYQFLPGTPDETKEIKTLDWNYCTLAQWLNYLNPGDKPHDPDLSFTDKKKVKPRALLSKSILDLAVALCPRVEQLKDRTPASVWFEWEVQQCHLAILNSGLVTGKGTPCGKVQWYENLKEYGDFLEAVDVEWKIHTQNKSNVTNVEPVTMPKLLSACAALEATKDADFRRCDAYQKYRQRINTWATTCRNDSFFTAPCFENGFRLPEGRKAARQPRRVSLGFVTKSLQK